MLYADISSGRVRVYQPISPTQDLYREVCSFEIADLLTKPLDKTTFLSLRTLLMTGSNEVP